MALTTIPIILCKEHDRKCPNCSRYIHSFMTKCRCGQLLAWEKHYDKLCTFEQKEKAK